MKEAAADTSLSLGSLSRIFGAASGLGHDAGNLLNAAGNRIDVGRMQLGCRAKHRRSAEHRRTIKAWGASLRATQQPIDSGKCFLDMLGVFAAFKTNLHWERQLEGIARRRLACAKAGRRPSTPTRSAGSSRMACGWSTSLRRSAAAGECLSIVGSRPIILNACFKRERRYLAVKAPCWLERAGSRAGQAPNQA
jgi:hypothetical protein